MVLDSIACVKLSVYYIAISEYHIEAILPCVCVYGLLRDCVIQQTVYTRFLKVEIFFRGICVCEEGYFQLCLDHNCKVYKEEMEKMNNV